MEVDAVLPNHSSSEPSHGSNADILEIDYGPWFWTPAGVVVLVLVLAGETEASIP